MLAQIFKNSNRLYFAVAIAGIVIVGFLIFSKPDQDDKRALRILAYSSFVSSWGPGPVIAEMFEKRYPEIKVTFTQADDAGLLLAKMRSFRVDIVLGFDQLGRQLAKKSERWTPHDISGSRYSDEDFLAFDWAPLGFLYREGEIEPPKNFEDLLSARFAGTIALQDPRSSSPGFQMMSWLVDEMGEREAFDFLRKLKPNVHSMSGSWSQAYGLFTRGLAKITFGYMTSVLYHRLTEKDDRYRFVTFSLPHPVQVEYAAISKSTQNVDRAKLFMNFLLEPETQRVIMNKNWMFPIDPATAEGTEFEILMKQLGDNLQMKARSPLPFEKFDADALLKRWGEAVL